MAVSSKSYSLIKKANPALAKLIKKTSSTSKKSSSSVAKTAAASASAGAKAATTSKPKDSSSPAPKKSSSSPAPKTTSTKPPYKAPTPSPEEVKQAFQSDPIVKNLTKIGIIPGKTTVKEPTGPTGGDDDDPAANISRSAVTPTTTQPQTTGPPFKKETPPPEEMAKILQSDPIVKNLTKIGIIPGPTYKPPEEKTTVTKKIDTDPVETSLTAEEIKQQEENQKAWEKFLDESEGKTYRVKWRGYEGNIKYVITYNLEDTITNIPEKHGGQVVQIYPQTNPNVVNKSKGILTSEYEEKVLASPTTSELIDEYKKEQRAEYQKTGRIPPDIKEQLLGTIPPEIESTIGTDEYIKYSYEVMLGIKTEEQASAALQTDLKTSYAYMSRYGYGKTIGEIQKDEPAARLKQKESGEYYIDIDTVDWQRKQMEYLGRGETITSTPIPMAISVSPTGGVKSGYSLPSVDQMAKGFSEVILAGFANPAMWWDQLTKGEGFKQISDKSYTMQKKLYNEQYKSYVIEDVILADPMKYIVYPFAIGAGFTAGFGAVGAAGAGAAGTTTGAALTGFATYAPIVTGGTMAGVVGADIGYSAALEQAGKLPEGTTGTKTLAIGMSVLSAGAGAEWASNPQTQAAFKQFGQNASNKFNASIKKFPALDKQIQAVKNFRSIGYEQRIMAQSVRDYPFHSLEGTKAPVGYRVKSFLQNLNFKEPSASYYIQKYAPSSNKRSDILIAGRKPYGSQDLFMSQRAPAKWGGYETSWDYYRGTLAAEGYKDTGFIREYYPRRPSMVKVNNYLFDPKTKQVIKLETDYTKPIEYKSKVVELSERPGFELRTPEYSDPLKFYKGKVTNLKTKYTEPYPDFAKGGLPKSKDMGEVWGFEQVRQTSVTPWKFKPVVKGGGKTPGSQQITQAINKSVRVSSSYKGIGDITKYEWYRPPLRSVSYAPTIGRGGVRMPGGYAIASGAVSIGFLNFLEEGTGTASGYWDKTIKDVRSQSKTGTGFISLNKMGIGLIPGSRVNLASLNKSGLNMINKNMQNVSNIQAQGLKQDQFLKQDQIFKTVSLTSTIPKNVYDYDYKFKDQDFDDYFKEVGKPKTPFVFPPEDALSGLFKKGKLPKVNILGRGYRYRRVKVPKLEDLFKGGINY
ncbi:MAG: hypothetical protein GF375_00480 [Candidatus Omnitrophica bacterium]|nr:hypothetical protein [Candidatus Omnitrophota bacterium]